jgi:hypothetical protein
MKADLSRYRCAEPEETIKQQAMLVLDTAIAAFPDSSAVRIEASGSQSPDYGADSKPTGRFSNTLSVVLTSLHGFVE